MTARERWSPLRLASWLVWRWPQRRAVKMAEFAHTEVGSSHDMLEAAADESSPPERRRKFFRHALDELRHSRAFAERARALSVRWPGARRILEDAGYLRAYGIRGMQPLHRELGTVMFLAFVWFHERKGARQFRIYADLLRRDKTSAAMFERIMKDELFHIKYSRLELDKMALTEGEACVRRAVRTVKWRHFKEAWLRFARAFGEAMASVWLAAIFFVLLTPFTVIARRRERPRAGFIDTPDAQERARRSARQQA